MVIRQADAQPSVIHSAVIDEHTRIGGHERSLTVDLGIYVHEVSDYVAECHLTFMRESEWLDCMCLLIEAKSQFAEFSKRVQYNLKLAGLEQFEPASQGAEDESL
ncbi:hypothetical protein L226DRAFT_576884 [Lentinus tigrinus ALCF2SS1-7]|uniref:uncharacterized protein n=1 Tax=Lentinus tigrinus ALCF2SS1-7 TaxID=1328758 RepID=UPI001165F280|nr:hypothetical protein L226DRAFT_576884 [Lentinus tigrinus ALCF2SS1-7]